MKQDQAATIVVVAVIIMFVGAVFIADMNGFRRGYRAGLEYSCGHPMHMQETP